MRSRSSRLFVVLLSLVGVSTNIPRKHGSHRGIVGVNPMAILLERLDLQDFDDGLDGLLRNAGGPAAQDWLLAEPYWLQDDYDGMCLGPDGFSECGDATLWHIRRRPPPTRRGLLKRWLLSLDAHIEEKRDWGFAFQMVDDNSDHDDDDDDADDGKQSLSLMQSKDCLVRRRRNGAPLGLGKCTSLDTAWSWRVSGEGILFYGGGKRLHPSQCLWRRTYNGTSSSSSSSPVLSSCEADEEDLSSRLVRFSFVRFHSASSQAATRAIEEDVANENRRKAKAVEAAAAHRQQHSNDDDDNDNDNEDEMKESEEAEHSPLTSVDVAHRHASEPLMHPDLKPSSQLLFSQVRDASSLPKQQKQQHALMPHDLLKRASPVLFALEKEDIPQPQPPPPSLERSAPVKLRKMPTHPYIAAAKDNVWKDPQTGLEFRTDLCEYLGHDRRESGRHTLTGVGQYMRTVFNIKVYGVALYVAKRDVLADPLFEQFSSLSQDELRERPDFYSHLRHMPSPLDDRGGLFDRTLLLKLNMQLSTDTMRSSLEADWKMLTDERKDLLISSSLEPRPADERMLRTIQSEENPGRCSCGQVAPEEYGADPSCCSRGTELVFTWRKNGDLEIRLDGRTMDIFPRPDVAAGIFFEYLRDDDPISVDFLNNVVEGFPFLLAPLSQVKGVSAGIMSPPSSFEDRYEDRAFFRAVGGFADMVSSQTENLGGWIQDNANSVAKGMATAVQSAGDTARNIGEEMDRRREILWRQVSSLQESGMHFVASRLHPNRRALSTMPSWMKDMGGMISENELADQDDKRHAPGGPRGRVFGSPLSRWLGESQEATLPDEIGPMIHPTMNLTRKVFLAMVHLYLMLLLIVSLPADSKSTRTKLVVRRRKSRTNKSKRDRTAEPSTRPRPSKAKEGKTKAIETNADERQGNQLGQKSLSYSL